MPTPRNVKYNNLKWFSWLVIANSLVSVNQWAKIPVGNQFFVWLVDFSLLFWVFRYIYRHRSMLFAKEYVLCTIYLLYAGIGVVRGAFRAENYWEYKQLVDGTLMVSLPAFVYIFRNPLTSLYVMRKWNAFMLLAFVIFFSWSCSPSCYFYLLPFILFYGSFYSELPSKWKILVFVLLVLFCIDYSNRSNIIKVIITICVAFGYGIRNILPNFMYKIVHHFLYVILFLVLGFAIVGNLNVLEVMSSNQNPSLTSTNAQGTTENVSDDTRTFIYYEVISSALKNNYVVLGNTPARGNVSEFFVTGNDAKDKDLTGKGERFANELVHLNIFTWLGIVGLILYSLIYFQSSYYAVFKSKNVFMKLIGCTIAFHWLYGWIEDYNSFTVQNIWLWLMISMGLSSHFLNMSDKAFKCYFTHIFLPNKVKKSHKPKMEMCNSTS